MLSTQKSVSPGGTALKAAAASGVHGWAKDDMVAVWLDPGKEKVTLSPTAA